MANTHYSRCDGNEAAGTLAFGFWCPAPSRPIVIICQNEKKQGNLPFPRDTFPGLPCSLTCTASLRSGPALNIAWQLPSLCGIPLHTQPEQLPSAQIGSWLSPDLRIASELWDLAHRGRHLPYMSHQRPGLGSSSQAPRDTMLFRAHIFSSHMSCFRNILLSPACWHMSIRGKCSAILVAVVVLTRQIVTFPSHRWSLCKAAAGHALPSAMGQALQDPCKLEIECLFQLGGQPSLALGGLFWILANVTDSK